jgi:hypothetical protein
MGTLHEQLCISLLSTETQLLASQIFKHVEIFRSEIPVYNISGLY